MEAITLEKIEAEHARIGELIEQFKVRSRTTEYQIDAVTIPLAPGERFAGPVLNADGTLRHYLIKLPGEVEDASFGEAREWADKRGGGLPTRQEQSLLFANLKSEFQAACYWSDEEYERNDAYAWYQDFSYGYQDCSHKYYELRAVAVRRFIPSII